MSGVAHLVRRFIGSLSSKPPVSADLVWVRQHLLPAELAMWERFGPADQRHTIAVARRFVDARPEASRPEIALSLIHI